MTQPSFDDDDFLDQPLKLGDFISIIIDDVEDAVGALNEEEVKQLVRAIRGKLKDIEGDGEPVEEPTPRQWWLRD